MPFTASGDSWSGRVPALATTTFGAGSGLLPPLLSGQMESSIILSLRLVDRGPALDVGIGQERAVRGHAHPRPVTSVISAPSVPSQVHSTAGCPSRVPDRQSMYPWT